MYEIRLSFDKWSEFLRFMAELHEREMREGMHSMEDDKFRPRFRFQNLGEDEDIEALMKKYPIAFMDTSEKSEAEIRKIHELTEKMARRPEGALKVAASITVDYILSRIQNTITSDNFFLALPLTIAALFKIRCGEKFEEGQKRYWQDELDLALFLLVEYGFNAKGIRNALEILDEFNLIDIDKDYSEDKNNPKIAFRANNELYNLLLPDEIAF